MEKRQASTITKEELLQLYVNNEYGTIVSTCNALKCCYPTFRKAMETHNLKAKSKLRNFKRKPENPLLSDREWLKEQLITKSCRQIARELGTTSGNVSDRVLRYDLRGEQYTRSKAIKAGQKKTFSRWNIWR